MKSISTTFRHQKRKFNIKGSDTRWYVGQTVASFSGMIIALSWNDLLQNFVDVLKEDFPILSIFGGVFAAALLTIIAVGLGILFLNSLGNTDKKVEQIIDASKHWKVDFFDRRGIFIKKTRYFTLSDLQENILNQFHIQNIETENNTIKIQGEDEFHGYILKLIPIKKSEYEENSAQPLPIFQEPLKK